MTPVLPEPVPITPALARRIEIWPVELGLLTLTVSASSYAAGLALDLGLPARFLAAIWAA